MQGSTLQWRGLFEPLFCFAGVWKPAMRVTERIGERVSTQTHCCMDQTSDETPLGFQGWKRPKKRFFCENVEKTWEFQVFGLYLLSVPRSPHLLITYSNVSKPYVRPPLLHFPLALFAFGPGDVVKSYPWKDSIQQIVSWNFRLPLVFWIPSYGVFFWMFMTIVWIYTVFLHISSKRKASWILHSLIHGAWCKNILHAKGPGFDLPTT